MRTATIMSITKQLRVRLNGEVKWKQVKVESKRSFVRVTFKNIEEEEEEDTFY